MDFFIQNHTGFSELNKFAGHLFMGCEIFFTEENYQYVLIVLQRSLRNPNKFYWE